MPLDLNNTGGPERPRYDAEDISRALAACAERWVPEEFPQGRIVDGVLRLANIKGAPPRKQGSCVIQLSGEHAGGWYDHEFSKGGEPLSTLAEAHGIRGDELFSYAIDIIDRCGATSYLTATAPTAARINGKANGHAANGHAPAATDKEKHAAEVAVTLAHMVPIAGTMAETYLRSRALTQLPDTPDLGFNPDTTHWQTRRAEPAMIARFRYPDGTPSGGIHRIYLRHDGSWHTGEKKMLGTVDGALVMLSAGPDAEGRLGIGEGVESTAAAMQLFSAPGWAAASDGGMKKFAAWLRANWRPDKTHSIKRLLVWADAKRAGVAAAGELYATAQEIGLAAELYLPGSKDDFAEDLKLGLRPGPPSPPSPPSSAQEVLPPVPSMGDPLAAARALTRDYSAGEVSRVVKLIVAAKLDPLAEQQALDTVRRRTGLKQKALDDAVRQARGAPNPPARRASWLTQLATFDNGEPKPILMNVATALRESDEWRGVIGFNDFTGMIGIRTKPPYERLNSEAGENGAPVDRPWTDIDERRTTEWIQRAGIHAQRSTVFEAVEMIAAENTYHPVREYLDTISWDGTKRLDSWSTYYLGVDDGAFAQAAGARWLISAVARIYRPGCKADCALILEGKQGLGKSTALRIMGGEWFTDEIDDFGSKDAALQMRGVWIIELAELVSFSRSEINRIKAFMSRTNDRFRPPYGRMIVEAQRQCVFGGSVNDDEYLHDPSGARRFWPLRCQAIDKDALWRDRDQLWAEAKSRYDLNEKWWIDAAEDDLLSAANEEQEERFESDAWESVIAEWLRDNYNRQNVTTADILSSALGITDRSKWSRSDQTRVGICLRRLGWKVAPRSRSSNRERRYERPN